MLTTIVFAGAGASKAVNPSEYPTTVEFFQRLPQNITNHTLFARAVEYLQTQTKDADAIDIEQMLWVLHELDTFLASLLDSDAVAGWFLRGDRLFSQFSAGTNSGNLFEHAPKTRELIRTFQSGINKQVYDFYARLPERYELETNWLALLRPMATQGANLELFTTNYDVIIETAIEMLAAEPTGRPIINTGRRPGLYQSLDQHLWARGPQDELPKPTGLLTKLHGSVDWSRDGDQILVGNPQFKGEHEKHVILYPGFKGTPTETPFSLFHTYLAGAVARAHAILFIGFAFRDEYINDILRRFTASHSRIFVIDPAPSLPHLPYPKGRVTHVPKGFDLESIQPTLNLMHLA